MYRHPRGHLWPQRGPHHIRGVLQPPDYHRGRASLRLPVHPQGAEDRVVDHDTHHRVATGVHGSRGARVGDGRGSGNGDVVGGFDL